MNLPAFENQNTRLFPLKQSGKFLQSRARLSGNLFRVTLIEISELFLRMFDLLFLVFSFDKFLQCTTCWTVIKYRFSCCKSTLSLFCAYLREISAKLIEVLKVYYFRLKANTTYHRKFLSIKFLAGIVLHCKTSLGKLK